MAWRGSFSVYGEGIRCACGPRSFSCLISIAFARWALVHGTIFLVRGVTLSMAGNARKGSHCIGIVFLCQKWRLWGLFFAGWSFAMKSMLPLIRQNVFLAVSHSPFLELLTLQKGPIAPSSATTAIAWMHVAYCQASLLVAPRRPLRAFLFPLSPYVEPPCSSCGVNAFETHITLRCNMCVTLVKRCIHTLETLHSLPSPCGAAHRHAPVATRPPRLELPGLGQWGK